MRRDFKNLVNNQGHRIERVTMRQAMQADRILLIAERNWGRT